MSIGIVDIGVGNLGSLRQALHVQGWDVAFVSNPDDLKELTHLFLPGVGAFKAAVQRLHHAKLFTAIRHFAEEGNPIMGICLGMQLLAERGFEGGEADGLGLIPGFVSRIDAPGMRLPHMGWNNAHQIQFHPLLKGIRDDVDFYFVHSYRFVAYNADHVLALTEYSEFFPSVVGKENVVGVQFHPEKSQANGLRLLDNFCCWDGNC
jgi:glutamine amidotransferase